MYSIKVNGGGGEVIRLTVCTYSIIFAGACTNPRQRQPPDASGLVSASLDSIHMLTNTRTYACTYALSILACMMP